MTLLRKEITLTALPEGRRAHPGTVVELGPYRWLLIGAARRIRPPPGYPGHLGGFSISILLLAWVVAHQGWPGHLQSDLTLPSLHSHLPLCWTAMLVWALSFPSPVHAVRPGSLERSLTKHSALGGRGLVHEQRSAFTSHHPQGATAIVDAFSRLPASLLRPWP